MLRQPLLDKLSQLRLLGVRQALQEQWHSPHYADLAFEERLGLLLDIEVTRRADNRLKRRIRQASFPLQATVIDLDTASSRGLPRPQLLHLAQGDWVRHHLNTLILGPTGVGKTFLASALGRAMCEAEFTVRYFRTSRLLHQLTLAQADGSWHALLAKLARTQLLIFDDWLRDPLSRPHARDLLEILDDRFGSSATMIVTQVPVPDWHARIPDPTLADALLDRLIHNAYRIELKGDSMRKRSAPLDTL